MELIKISTQNGNAAISAKDLHLFLGSKKDFSAWIKNRIDKYGLVENQDYTVFTQSGVNPLGGRPSIDYVLTIDAAKELAMVEGNAKGKQARQYFIDCEKRLTKSLSPAELILQQAQMLVDIEKQNKEILSRQTLIETRIDKVEAKSVTRPEYYTIAGYASLNNIKCPITMAATLGKRASIICKKENIVVEETHDPRFGKVNVYPVDILKQVFK